MDLHTPVLTERVVEFLELGPGKVIIDCTIGCGGHAKKILEQIQPGGKLIGIDQDDDALNVSGQRLASFKNSYTLLHDNFRNLRNICRENDIAAIDGLLFDLGVASIHFDTPFRGFSVRHDGPLDMRMDRRTKIMAEYIVNRCSYDDLEHILREYGEERRSRKIAHAIIETRKKKPIATTHQLAQLVERIYAHRYGRLRIHPATRTFQALRIAVNDELDALYEGLVAGIEQLRTGGRIVVIAFHSLEDRIVKRTFRDYQQKGMVKLITKSPMRPDEEEIRKNPRARSAKLRTAERI
jgi:16S rRNA (cytosine1402-N4)-methyltransferase